MSVKNIRIGQLWLMCLLILLLTISSCGYRQMDESEQIDSSIQEETEISETVNENQGEEVEEVIPNPEDSVTGVHDEGEDFLPKESVDESDEKTQGEQERLVLRYEILPIDEDRAQFMMGRSFHENNNISLEDLRVVYVPYYGFDDQAHQGELIVHEAIAEVILEIFTELYEGQYPIEAMEPVSVYEGSDHASMVANNTSAFNYRVVAGTTHLSNHAYGLAVDINPLINPYVTSSGIDPIEGEVYADRRLDVKGMIHKGDMCYNAFVTRGFSWGGDWVNSKDYQHFDIKVEGLNK